MSLYETARGLWLDLKPRKRIPVYTEPAPDNPRLASYKAAEERAASHVRRTMREWPYGYVLRYRLDTETYTLEWFLEEGEQ